MDGNGLLDDKTILDELSDVLPGVCVGNLTDLVRIQPHLRNVMFIVKQIVYLLIHY